MEQEMIDDAAQLARSTFRDHGGALQRFLLRRVGNPQDADDLAQEVFARLLRVRDAVLVRDPRAYLLGIATHVIHEFRTRRQHDLPLCTAEAAEDALEAVAQTATLGVAERLELQDGLGKALAKLPPTHRLVLLLVKRDGHSYSEAARLSGLSIHTIEKYVVEARARLRVLLADTQR
jgi:RNA polymerase sigma-70 factor (ECF subfamily)